MVDKCRKKLTFSQWLRTNSSMFNDVKFELSPIEDKKWRTRPEYRRWRNWCMLRDGGHCQFCGATSKLSVHHIIPSSICAQLRYDIRNGLTLCIRCHKAKAEFIHQMNPRWWEDITSKQKRRRR